MSTPRITSRVCLGLAVWACATLLLELSLTRVLSVALWYHFGFLVISTALLGFGVAGTALSVWPRLRDVVPLDRALVWLACGFSLMTVVSFRLMQALPFDPFRVLVDPSQLLWGPLYYVVLALPFGCAGLGLSLLFTRHAAGASRLYAWDLAGAGVGCLLLLAVMPAVGGSGAVLLASALGLTAAALFAPGRRQTVALVALAGIVAGAAPFGDRLLPIAITPLKFRPAIAPLETHWNSASRVEVFELRPPGITGTVRRFTIDGGTAATGIQDLRPDVREYLRTHTDDSEYLSGVAYPGKPSPDVLVIGSGGGADVLDALHFGARRITAIEVNPTIVDLVSTGMRDYWGNLFQQPEVRLVEDEGRSFLRRSSDRYDAIISRHTISNAAVASGAMALTENYILTREAFEDYLDHLTPDGMIFFSRPEPHLPRLMATAREALLAKGVADATRHFYVFREVPAPGQRNAFGQDRQAFDAQLIVKKSPLTAADVAGIQRIAQLDRPAQAGQTDVRETVYSPDAPARAPLYHEIASTTDLPALYARQSRELAPATDDRPFFNHLTRWSSLDLELVRQMAGAGGAADFLLGDRPVAEVSLVLLLVQAAAVAAVMILWPLWRQRGTTSAGLPWSALVYFAALGFGFIVIEMALLSRLTLFLGQPAYTIAIVLGGLLVFTGAGAAVSSRLTTSPGTVQRAIALLLVMVAAQVFVAPLVLNATLGWPFVARGLVVLVLLAPLGVLLGIPFPVGVRLVAQTHPALVPWAWGVNGFFTVIGTVVGLMLAMTYGFTVAVGVAAGCYVAAMAAGRSARGWQGSRPPS